MPVDTEDALPAEDGRDEIRERLAGAGAGLGQEDAAVGEHVRDRSGHFELPRARLEPVERGGERTAGREYGIHGGVQSRPSGSDDAYASGYSGNFRHRASTSAFTRYQGGVVVR